MKKRYIIIILALFLVLLFPLAKSNLKSQGNLTERFFTSKNASSKNIFDIDPSEITEVEISKYGISVKLTPEETQEAVELLNSAVYSSSRGRSGYGGGPPYSLTLKAGDIEEAYSFSGSSVIFGGIQYYTDLDYFQPLVDMAETIPTQE